MEIKKRHIRAGLVEEVSTFPVYSCSTHRGPKSHESSAEKKKQNLIVAIHRLARLINCNFGRDDQLLTLTYTDTALRAMEESINPLIQSEERDLELYRLSQRNLDNYIERCLYHASKHGITVKYIAITADKSNRTGEPAHIHHHLIVNGTAYEIFTANWHCGHVNNKPMIDGPDYIKIASYFIEQVRQIKGKKHYKVSKNMEHPEISDEPYDGSPIVIPDNAILTDNVGYYYKWYFPWRS